MVFIRRWMRKRAICVVGIRLKVSLRRGEVISVSKRGRNRRRDWCICRSSVPLSVNNLTLDATDPLYKRRTSRSAPLNWRRCNALCPVRRQNGARFLRDVVRCGRNGGGGVALGGKPRAAGVRRLRHGAECLRRRSAAGSRSGVSMTR